MGRIVRELSRNLAIELDDPPARYQVGGVILGRVVRRSHVVSTAGRVTIRFLGRSKSIVDNESPNSFSFFAFDQLEETLHHGPMNLAWDWPFAIAIPEHANPLSICPGNRRVHTYISREPEDVAEHPLPATCYCKQTGMGGYFQGYVEYWLEATLALDDNSVEKATFPIHLRTLPVTTLLADSELKEKRIKRIISTARMIPGMENAKPDLKQKAKAYFSSAKAPDYSFWVHVSAPSVIQLEHPTPIPFCIRAVPVSEETSEAIRGAPQTITLESLEIEIRSSWEVTFASNSLGSQSSGQLIDLGLKSILDGLKLQGPIVVPQGKYTEDLDIGQQLDLRLSENWVYAFGGKVRAITLPPSFATYNIRNTHAFHWAIHLRVAGEQCTVMGHQPLNILGAYEEWDSAGSVPVTKQPRLTTQEAAPSYDSVERDNAEAPPSYQEATAGKGGESSRAGGGVAASRADVKRELRQDD